MSARLLRASSGVAAALCTPVSGRSLAADEALLTERHVVTGWNVHSLTMSCETHSVQSITFEEEGSLHLCQPTQG